MSGINKNNAEKVTAGKPKVGGAVFRAAKGSTIPTSAVTELSSDYKCLGYCSEDGLSNANDSSSDKIAAWGGDVVLNMVTAGTDTFKLTLIESINTEVLKTVHGNDNVTVDATSGDITVAVNGGSGEEYVYVFDLILKNNVLKRIVVPCATVSEVGEVVYKDNEAVAYEVTLTAINDSSGNSHYEYIHI